MRRTSVVVACAFAVIPLLVGCGTTPVRRPAAKLDPKPYLLHLPGITGGFWMHDQYTRALQAGGFDAETAIYDWTGSRFSLSVLGQREQNLEQADKIARFLTKKHQENPQRPLYLSCESGGAGVLVWALEKLPDDVQVEAAILVSPALSTTYDLTPALRHVRKRMLVFPSKSDGLVLGFGTLMFGTMDRKHEKSAGLDGFTMPATADAAQYAKLEQYPYRGKFFWDYGNGGGHAWALYPHFASAYLASRLLEIARSGGADECPCTQPADHAYAVER
jgi:hypothetical protein